jgi:hypothetical protein
MALPTSLIRARSSLRLLIFNSVVKSCSKSPNLDLLHLPSNVALQAFNITKLLMYIFMNTCQFFKVFLQFRLELLLFNLRESERAEVSE